MPDACKIEADSRCGARRRGMLVYIRGNWLIIIRDQEPSLRAQLDTSVEDDSKRTTRKRQPQAGME